MAVASGINGRMEKRLPIVVVVHLARVQDHPVIAAELTYTENVSAHGACVISKRAWQLGELAQVTSFKEQVALRGKSFVAANTAATDTLSDQPFKDAKSPGRLIATTLLVESSPPSQLAILFNASSKLWTSDSLFHPLYFTSTERTGLHLRR